jgi:hypothetical protein
MPLLNKNQSKWKLSNLKEVVQDSLLLEKFSGIHSLFYWDIPWHTGIDHGEKKLPTGNYTGDHWAFGLNSCLLRQVIHLFFTNSSWPVLKSDRLWIKSNQGTIFVYMAMSQETSCITIYTNKNLFLKNIPKKGNLTEPCIITYFTPTLRVIRIELHHTQNWSQSKELCKQMVSTLRAFLLSCCDTSFNIQLFSHGK